MRRRLLFWLLGALPAILVLLGTLWLAASPAALGWLAGEIAARSGERLRVEALSGSLLGPLRAGRIVYCEGGQTITAEDVELSWSPLHLLSGRLHIDRLAAGALHIAGAGDDAPLALPSSLAPPLPLTIHELTLDTLERDGRPLAQAIRLSLDGDEKRWRSAALRLQMVAADTSITVAASELELAAAAPYALRGKAMLEGRMRGQDARLRIDASGTPAAIDLKLALDLELTPGTAKGSGHARLTPLDRHTLGELALVFDGKVGAGGTAPGAYQAELALRLDTERLLIKRLQLDVSGARIETAGTVGLGGDRVVDLAGRLVGVDPSRFGDYPAAHLGGTFSAKGRLAPAPAGSFAFTLADSRYRDAPLTGHGEIELVGGRLAAASVDLSLDDGPRIDTVKIRLDGRRDRHRIAAAAQLSGTRLDAMLEGGLSAPATPLAWQGRLVALSGSGRLGFALQAPAELTLSPQRQRLAGAALALIDEKGTTAGHLRIDHLSREGDRIESAGTAQGLSPLRLWPAAAAQLEGTLALGGEWQLRGDRQLAGQLKLWREQGDLRPRLDHGPTLGLRKLAATLRVADGRVDLAADIDAAAIGRARVSGSTALSRGEQGWGMPANAPLTLAADADLPDLAWLGRLLPQSGLETAGALRLEAQAQGTPRQPRLSGRLAGSRLALRLPEQGVDLRDGTLAARFDGDRLVLDELRLHGAAGTSGAAREGGSLRASGTLPFAGDTPVLTLDIVFDRLRALARPDRLLVIDGTTRATLRREQVAIDGRLRVVRGLFQLPEADALTTSNDVSVAGRTAPPPATTALRTTVDLRVDLGDDFKLGGRGLDARLAGRLRLQAAAGAPPTAHGSLRLVDGRYAAYGQNLAIERGIINFVGPLDNPGLDILALRKNQPVEAGVALTGTALAPQAKLTSNPWVPDADKLSWLVLGHGLDAGGKGDLQLLATAAGTLLGSGQAGALQTRLAHAFGLDELSFGTAGSAGGGLEGATLTLGKRLSADARISFEQALTGTGTLARFHYQLTRHLSVRTQAGSDNAADLFYTWSFD